MNCVNLSISLPRSDMNLLCLLGERMGWQVKPMQSPDALSDPEGADYLDEETKQDILEMVLRTGVLR